ncbi:MAG: NAD(P)/FAD-dependent oxidoreductase [Candidatus Syntropharchaeia archaeon]
MKSRYDVVVVGAGPAGSICARFAADKGLDVLLIEKRQEIGTPVRCAEGVSKAELEKVIPPDRRWISAEVNRGVIYSPDGTKIVLSEKNAGAEVGYVLERKIFDRELARRAAEMGAEVYVKTRAYDVIRKDGFVRGIRAKQMGKDLEVRAEIVVGADGVESKVGRWAGIDTRLKPSDIETCAQYLMCGIEIDSTACEFYLGNEIAPGGYAWIFPKGEDSANVGIGVNRGRAVDYLKKFVKSKFPDGKIIEMVFGGVPVSGPIERTITNGLMLIGDAARQSDPVTGGGIANAMEAGKIAADVAVQAIERGDPSENSLNEYEERWRSTIGEKIGRTLKVKEMFQSFTDEDFNTLAHSIEGIPIEEYSVFGLMVELVKRNPKMLFKLRHLF